MGMEPDRQLDNGRCLTHCNCLIRIVAVIRSAPGYLGRRRGEVVRPRTTVLQAHTHQWLGSFGGAGNGDDRGELLRAREVIASYLTAKPIERSRGIVRLDGQYGDGAIVADLAGCGLGYVVRGKDYALLNLPEVQARLAQPPDQQTTHPETGTSRSLFDFPDLPVTPTGPRSRVIVATHPATVTANPIGVTRDEVVYELFSRPYRQGRSPPPMSLTCICIVVLSRRCSPMRTGSRTQTAGVLIPLVDKNFGRLSVNGSGISAWSSGTTCHPLPCV